jgi:hypothetical protein
MIQIRVFCDFDSQKKKKKKKKKKKHQKKAETAWIFDESTPINLQSLPYIIFTRYMVQIAMCGHCTRRLLQPAARGAPLRRAAPKRAAIAVHCAEKRAAGHWERRKSALDAAALFFFF